MGSAANGPIIEQSRAEHLPYLLSASSSRPGPWATVIKGRIDNILIVFPRIEDREGRGYSEAELQSMSIVPGAVMAFVVTFVPSTTPAPPHSGHRTA